MRLLLLLIFCLSTIIVAQQKTVSGKWHNDLSSGKWHYKATTNFPNDTVLTLFFTFEKQLIIRKDVWVESEEFNFVYKPLSAKKIMSGRYDLHIHCPQNLSKNIFLDYTTTKSIVIGDEQKKIAEREKILNDFERWLSQAREILDFLEKGVQNTKDSKAFLNKSVELKQQIIKEKRKTLKTHFSSSLNRFYKLADILLSIQNNFVLKKQKNNLAYLRQLYLKLEVIDSISRKESKNDKNKEQVIIKTLEELYAEVKDRSSTKKKLEKLKEEIESLNGTPNYKNLIATLYWLKVYASLNKKHLSSQDMSNKKKAFELRLKLLFHRLSK